ncbi:MAG: ammonium transporter, partial [Phycisphaerales bacterium]
MMDPNVKGRRLLKRLVILAVLAMSVPAWAGEAAAPSPIDAIKTELQTNINIVWTLVAAFLVFFMQAGFAMVETGFTRAKNSVNILMKNAFDFVIGSLAFFFIGFGLMFGKSNGLFGTTLFGLSGIELAGNDWMWTFLIFQTVFAATSATIVSGAMAERTKFISYLIYSGVISLVIYPIFGSWAWGSLSGQGTSGWL